MNNYIKNTLKKYLLILFVMILSFAYSIKFLVSDEYFKDISNSCRVLVSDQLNNIIIGKNNKKADYKYTIVSLDGNVIKTTEDKNIKTISLNNLSMENWYDVDNESIIRYSTPMIIDNVIDKVVIFSIPKEDIMRFRDDVENKYIYKFISLILFTLIIFILYKIYRLINKDVLLPIKEMHKSAREIIKGNYLEKVIYDYDGEIGAFSHDFEKMRDRLVYAKKREEELQRAEKELLACISHDLKTPIANISGYCEGIIDGIVKSEKDIKKYTGVILKKVRVLTKLLDDILELSKAEINEMSINKREVYTEEFFMELGEEIALDVISSGRTFNFEGEIPNMILSMDEEKITQAINNIISNAIKYTNDDGIINMGFRKLDKGIEIRIEDNGIGIATNEVDLVFNKFYRSEKHRNQNIPGSGLGLAIVKYIVENHGGSISIISNKGKGCLVLIRLRDS